MEAPIGSIIMGYKSTSLIPSGWVLCDGSSGTPDLRGKFVIGVNEDAYKGDPYGADTHSHTNSVAQNAGDHIHDVIGTLSSTVSHDDVSETSGGASTGVSPTHTHSIDFDLPTSGNHQHTTSNTVAATNLPPYLQVYYIMRTV